MEARELTNNLLLPDGIQIFALEHLVDTRGHLTELYRHAWMTTELVESIQWNYVKSHANVLRGMHLHIIHTDYLILLEGKMLLALRDVRTGSPTEGLACVVELVQEKPQAILIPPGIMHSFFYPMASIHIYGVNRYWDTSDEFGCIWNDPDLELPWSMTDVILSEKDLTAPSFKQLMKTIGPLVYTK